MSERALTSAVKNAAPTITAMPGAVMQRACACGQHTGGSGECDACKEKKDSSLQRWKSSDAALSSIPPIVDEVLRSPGQPLDLATRTFMEARFNHDFSSLRVHHDAAAAASAQAVHSRAYTVGNHVVFGASRYAPSTSSGQALLAHELAHTIQQGMGHGGDYRTAEREADRAGSLIHSETPLTVSSAGAREPIQRQEADEDKDRTTIVGVTKRTGERTYRAWELVWRMLSRYFPEYVGKISGVSYKEKEQGVRVDVEPIEVKGKKTQSASVIVGKRFIDESSEETLRARIQELGLALSSSGLKADGDAAPPAALWKIIQDKFPTKGRRLSGTSYDANLPGLRTEFDSGKVTVGKVTKSWSGPMMYFGKAFLAMSPEDQEKKVGEQLAKVDQWSVENGHLVKDDLQDRDIADRIRGLSGAKLAELRDKVTDPDVKKYADSLITMSTPLEHGLTRQGQGNATVVIGKVHVIVLPDASNVATAPAHGGETPFRRSTRPDPRALTKTDHGVITSFAGFPLATITIQTNYAADANPDQLSAYGRGTTERDKQVGATTLRFHEGSHGLDFLHFLSTHAYPTFTGAAGDTVVQFNTAIATYDRALRTFDQQIQDFTDAQTHCVGITIDHYNRDHRIRSRRECR